MSQPRATQAVVRNAIKAAQACGVEIREIIVGSDGTVKIVAMKAIEPLPSPTEGGADSWDEATGLAS